MNDNFEYAGLWFSAETKHDIESEEPWNKEDGHGVITDWVTREKKAGERVLAYDGRSKRYYDIPQTLKLAKADGWGLGQKELDKLTAKLGRAPTQKEVTAAAVEMDYARMRAWYNAEWSYVGVVVTLLDVDKNKTEEMESLWGIESDSTEYLEEVAKELAGTIAERVGDARALTKTIQIR